MRALMRFNQGEASITVEPAGDDTLERQVWDELIASVDGRGSLLEAIVSQGKIIVRKVKNVKP